MSTNCDIFYITVKEDGTLIRNEVECEITKNLYEIMKQCIVGNIITKRRYLIPIEYDLLGELDIYYDKLEGLVTIEVEFRDVNESSYFDKKIPAWFEREITYEKVFKNKMLSQTDYENIRNFIDIES